MLPEPLSHNVSPMNLGIVIWEHACAIREGMKRSVDGKTWSLSPIMEVANPYLWAENIAEPQPDHNPAITG